MNDTDTKLNQGLENLEKMFTSKTVVGDPIQLDGHTIVPLLSVGLGFGAGSGSSDDPRKKGEGGGFGGGGGVRPVALIISGKDGIHVERLVGATASTLEGLASIVGKMRGPGSKSEGAA